MTTKNDNNTAGDWEIDGRQPAAAEVSPVEAITRAEVDLQIATAHRFPRNIGKVKAELTAFATLDEETAAACFYRLPRGGKNIEGPSVRLAEIAVSCYGNLRAGTRIISIVSSGDSPHVLVEAVTHDLEKNTAVRVEKRRRIIGKTKNKGKPDEDDINLAANNASAVAFRDSVFKVVPAALVKSALDAAKRVARGEAKPMADRVAGALDVFAKMGISKEQVLAKLERKSTQEITGDDLDTLTGLRTAIREGEVSIEEEFGAKKGAAAGMHKAAADDLGDPVAAATAGKEGA